MLRRCRTFPNSEALGDGVPPFSHRLRNASDWVIAGPRRTTAEHEPALDLLRVNSTRPRPQAPARSGVSASRERSGAFDRAARARGQGRGKAARSKKRSGAAALRKLTRERHRGSQVLPCFAAESVHGGSESRQVLATGLSG